MEENEFYRLLVQRYIENTATEEELEVFFQLMKEGKLDAYLTDAMNAESFATDWKRPRAKTIRRKMITPARVSIAAVVLLLLSSGIFYFNWKSRDQQLPVAHNQKPYKNENNLMPGGDKAILVLGDGRQLNLDQENNGLVSQQGVTRIEKQDRELKYNTKNNQTDEVSYNTLLTPRGGQYRIVLSDSTKVWLNAASSLRFPTAFTGSERRVELTGEAYFEVAHNAKKPFIVQRGDAAVNVLGTHFDINAYDDEPEMKVTLLQGSVKVSKGEKTALLQPGQQAKMSMNSSSTSIRVDTDIDEEQVLAWKNGMFQFDGADIQEVMRNIARWYDVDIVYQGRVNQHFRGNISKYVDASKVLQMLEYTGAAHFKIEGKKIIVTP